MLAPVTVQMDCSEVLWYALWMWSIITNLVTLSLTTWLKLLITVHTQKFASAAFQLPIIISWKTLWHPTPTTWFWFYYGDRHNFLNRTLFLNTLSKYSDIIWAIFATHLLTTWKSPKREVNKDIMTDDCFRIAGDTDTGAYTGGLKWKWTEKVL